MALYGPKGGLTPGLPPTDHYGAQGVVPTPLLLLKGGPVPLGAPTLLLLPLLLLLLLLRRGRRLLLLLLLVVLLLLVLPVLPVLPMLLLVVVLRWLPRAIGGGGWGNIPRPLGRGWVGAHGGWLPIPTTTQTTTTTATTARPAPPPIPSTPTAPSSAPLPAPAAGPPGRGAGAGALGEVAPLQQAGQEFAHKARGGLAQELVELCLQAHHPRLPIQHTPRGGQVQEQELGDVGGVVVHQGTQLCVQP